MGVSRVPVLREGASVTSGRESWRLRISGEEKKDPRMKMLGNGG
jgi:hypothetical protein